MPSKKYTDKQKLAYYKKKAAAKARNNRKYVKGQGGYKIPRNFFSAPKVGGALGGAGGTFLGNMIAPGIGGTIGGAMGAAGGTELGRIFKKITGWGDYQVKSNSLVNAGEIVPSFGEDSIRVRKREFICGLNSVQDAFTLKSFPINPGMDNTFPWLSSIARNYEQYRVNGMIFQFVSTSSDAIASTTALGLGQVILATDYNASDEVFQDAPQMLNYMFSNSGKPSEHIMHAIECAPTDTAQKLYYVRTGDVNNHTNDQDLRLYDLGTFQIAVNNMPASYNGMGQLYVSYDITFVKSCQNNLLGWALNSDKFDLLPAAVGAITNANPFGSNASPTTAPSSTGSTLGCVLNTNTIFFPEGLVSGYYNVIVQWRGTAAAITRPTWTPVNCSLVQDQTSTALSYMASPANAVSSAILLCSFVVRLGTTNSSTRCSLVCSGGLLPTSGTEVDIYVNQVNGDIYDEFSYYSLAWS